MIGCSWKYLGFCVEIISWMDKLVVFFYSDRLLFLFGFLVLSLEEHKSIWIGNTKGIVEMYDLYKNISYSKARLYILMILGVGVRTCAIFEIRNIRMGARTKLLS